MIPGLRLGVWCEMCQVHHADLSEFELVLFISFATDMICEYQRKYEKNALAGVEISCYVNFKEF